MPQHVDTRYDRAASLQARNAMSAERHRARQAKAQKRGNEAKAVEAAELAERAERLARKHAQTVERLELPAARARTARRVNEKAAAAVLDKAMRASAAVPHPLVLPPKEATRIARAEEKREKMLRQADAARASSLRSAGLEVDDRTAAGQREIVVSNARDAAGKRGSLAEYGVLIRNQTDRTGPRIAAMRQFDELCHRAYAGLLPEPRFEPGVDTSAGPAGVTEARIAGLSEMQNLTRRIGDEAQAMLFHRVYERRTFTWMTGQGFGDERALAVLFLRAVDGVARFYGLVEQSRVVEFMEGRLAAVRA